MAPPRPPPLNTCDAPRPDSGPRACAGASGRLEAKKIIRIKGCPVKVKDLMMFLLVRIGVKSPVFDLRNLMLLIYYSAVSGWMKLTIPLRKKARLKKS